MKEEKINGTISLYFEIKDLEFFGGTGYSEIKVDFNAADLRDFQLQEWAESQRKCIAEMLSVVKENVSIISRKEYEENTEED